MNYDRLRSVDIPSVIREIKKFEPGIKRIFLFGSRRYETGSFGSDIDLLLDTEGNQNPMLFYEIRQFEPYIDLFQIKGNFAESTGNQSQIRSLDITTKEELIKKVDAIEIWNNEKGWIGADKYKEQKVILDNIPELTTATTLGYRDPARPAYDYLIITSIQKEFDAVYSQLKDIGIKTDFVSPTILGCDVKTKTGQRKIALSVSHRMGTVTAALNTQKRNLSGIS